MKPGCWCTEDRESCSSPEGRWLRPCLLYIQCTWKKSKGDSTYPWGTPVFRCRLAGVGLSKIPWWVGPGRFIQNYSSVASPLHALTSPPVRFMWSSETEAVFQRLKWAFVTASILIQLDPHSQFVLEVDASAVGIGDVLSQRSSKDNKFHPCAFLSHKLSPAERNCELLQSESSTIMFYYFYL